ncbi:hypothetical protein [Pseudactinotalea terrae]|uniref:hypothetical protein n=1 Tax=Pseudactinotalea terrae TaxID=1743262 RepID=UPI0012E1FCF7|nr:hypothetical protein [Pseudactinotalea terrae]
MENPARALADIFDVWALPPNQTADAREKAFVEQRGLASGTDVLAMAMRCVLDIETWLERLRETGMDVSIYTAKLPAWRRIIIARPAGQTNQKREAAPQQTRDDLRGLALLLDAHAAAFRPSQATLDKIEQAVADIKRDLVDLALDPTTHAYVLMLLEKILQALNDGDKEALRSRLAEFVGWADLSAEAAQDPGLKEKFRNLRNQLVYPTMAGATGNVISHVAVAFLTAGGGA